MAIHKNSLGFLLADVSRLMRKTFDQHLKSSSLTLAQARALVYVANNEGIRQVDLAELLEVQPITLGRLLDSLSEQGLVERRIDPTDGRAYRLALLPAAAPHLAAIDRVAATLREISMRHIDKRHAELVVSALVTMRENLSGH